MVEERKRGERNIKGPRWEGNNFFTLTEHILAHRTRPLPQSICSLCLFLTPFTYFLTPFTGILVFSGILSEERM